ncbi:MAG: hypothetical protein M3Z11_00590 [Candidatus Dormibacteraeota bacterium]|nr:hypothetical protein [Candidatus Dormibacteraeota bacterium]
MAGKDSKTRGDDTLELVRRASQVTDLHQVTTFRGTRKDKGGVDRDLTIEVLDMGAAESQRRFRVTATDSGGRTATGSPSATLEQALDAVRWSDLDAPMQSR